VFRKYLILMAFLAGCDDGGSTPEGAGGAGGGADMGAGGAGGGGEFELVPSRKARVKFKGGERALGDLAVALELDRASACTELGIYDCVTQVHRIALGGVEPYELRINDPLEVIPVTAAIAADRVALVACGQRVAADFEDPQNAKVFKVLASGDATAETLGASVDALYDRILMRAPNAEEAAALVALHADVVAEEGGDGRATWAKLACFAVATTLESLFF
jgi:hypothetical protein